MQLLRSRVRSLSSAHAQILDDLKASQRQQFIARLDIKRRVCGIVVGHYRFTR